jgi:hypothetical protein
MQVSISHPTDRPNFSVVTIGSLSLWFSYTTVIAFMTPEISVVCDNVWGPTTGKHLNYIDSNKANRVPRQEFLDQLEAVLNGQELSHYV